MIIYAEHIIGMTAHEAAQPELDASAKKMRRRYEAILACGALQPHTAPRRVGQDGGMFELDHLAGDGQYVFLSYGPRYRSLRPAHLCYGFVFDAATLINTCGALVGEDLLCDYEDLLAEAIEEVDASLPPLPVASDDEMERVAALVGDDPNLLAYIRQASASRYHDIERAVRLGDNSVEGMFAALTIFRLRVAELQALKRAGGTTAHAALFPGVEILVPARLSLDYAVGRIESGKLVLQ
jgi:hypothetical protein